MNANKQPIYLYDTLRREKVKFTPEDPDNVRMYVCGPTVYDFAHIGNARPNVVFDVLFRLLRHVYGADHVTYARNITDVDDKINTRAAEEHGDLPINEAIAEVTTRTTAQFHADIAALAVLEPTVEPRCTGHIGEATVGVALMGHPDNVRNQYYMQEWGLMEVSPCLNAEVEFSADKPFRFAARYVAHDGEIRPKTLDGLLRDFGRNA